MSTRGMTILEVLLALALLSSLVVAGFSWISIAARAGLQQRDRAEWHMAADAVVRLIRDDLLVGGVAKGEHDRRDRFDKLEIQNNELLVRTRWIRSSGEAVAARRYWCEPSSSTLWCEEIPVLNAYGRRRLLMEGVTDWIIELVQAEDGRRRLGVVIIGPEGGEVSCSFHLGEEPHR